MPKLEKDKLYRSAINDAYLYKIVKIGKREVTVEAYSKTDRTVRLGTKHKVQRSRASQILTEAA